VETALNREVTNELVQQHLDYAHAIAAELLRGCPPDIHRSDLERAAELGLVQAANSYDPSRGSSFVTYAYYRIRGSVYDELRQSRRANKVETTANDYRKNDTTSEGSEAKAEGADLDNAISKVVMSYLLSIENLSHEIASKTTESPMDRMLRKERKETIHRALKQLPTRNREVLRGYYFQELSLKQIGRRMGISESRVSRIHAKGLEKMRAVLNALRSTNGLPISRSA
jgi:RNA polymerase sigma factor for flagellar operon FliA